MLPDHAWTPDITSRIFLYNVHVEFMRLTLTQLRAMCLCLLIVY